MPFRVDQKPMDTMNKRMCFELLARCSPFMYREREE